MNILGFELKKLFGSKILIFLTVFCTGLNIAMFSSDFSSDKMDIVSDIISEPGTQINELGVKKFDDIYKNELAALREISPSAAKSYEEKGGIDYSRETRESSIMEHEYKLMLISLLRGQIEAVSGVQRKKALAEYSFAKIKDTDSNILKLVYLFELAMISDSEFSLEFFAPLSAEYVHSVLFGRIVPVFFTEMMFIAMLVTVRSCNYEFSEGTHYLVYTSKRGRRVQQDKLLASLITVSAVFAVLGAVTFGVYFIVNDLKEFLFIPLSSTAYGCIFSVADLSIAGLFGLCMLLGLAVALLSAVITYCISGVIKNPFGTIGIFVLLQFVCLLATDAVFSGNAGLLPKLLTATPVGLIFNFNISERTVQTVSGSLFCLSENSVPFFELFTVVLWGGICAVSAVLSQRCFRGKEL